MNAINSMNANNANDSINPSNSMNSTNSNWYALYTKSRHEKFVEQHLNDRGIEAFTPKATVRKRWSDRIKYVKEPLFKSYCFAKFPLKDKRKITFHKGIVKVVNFGGQYPYVEESVINSLKILSEQGIELKPHPYLKIGSRIVIKEGPLRGVEGYLVEKRKNETELIISVDIITSSAKCVIDAAFVEPV